MVVSLLAQRPHRFQDVVAGLRVDAHGRLVHDQELGPVREGARHVEAALHAPGELLRPLVRVLREADERERLRDPLRSSRAAQAVEAAEELQVLPGGQVLEDRDLLGHEPDAALQVHDARALGGSEHLHGARVDADQPREHPDGRGLAGAVGSQEAQDLAPSDFEIHVIQRQGGSEALHHVAQGCDGCPIRCG